MISGNNVKNLITATSRRGIHKVEILPCFSLLSERKTSLINNNKNKNNSKNGLTLAFIFFAIGGLVFSGVAFGSNNSNTALAQTTTPEAGDTTAQAIVDTQLSAVADLTNDDRTVGDLNFEIRWSPVATIEPDSVQALFADCAPGEFAVSSMHMFENEELLTVQSF